MSGKNKQIILLILLAIYMGPIMTLSAHAREISDGDFKKLRFSDTMEVKALEDVKEFVDDAVCQQNEVLDNIAEDFEKFLAEMSDIAADVADATNVWISDPNPETEAEVSRSVTEGAARGRKAAGEIAEIKDQVEKVTDVIGDSLNTCIRETDEAAKGAEGKASRYFNQLEKSSRAVLEAKKLLEEKGYFNTEEMPQELEEKLFRLAVDHQELEVVTKLWQDVGQVIAAYVVALNQAKADYNEIVRIAGRVSYQAESSSRIFAHVGQAEALKIQTKLLADAYSQSRALRNQMTSAFQRMKDIRGKLTQVVLTTKRLPQPGQRDNADMEKRITPRGLLDWFKAFNEAKEIEQ